MITYQRQEQEEIAAPFEAIVGPERARFDEATRQRYARTTGLQFIMPAGVLYPQTTQEVVEVVRAADPFPSDAQGDLRASSGRATRPRGTPRQEAPTEGPEVSYGTA
jgi:hypothetical protein